MLRVSRPLARHAERACYVRRLIAALWLALIPAGLASAAPAGGEPEPIDRQPYAIDAHVLIDPLTRIDAKGRAVLLAEWRALIGRFVGAPWDLSVHDDESTLAATPLESLGPEAFAPLAGDHDKVWVIRVQRQGSGFLISGREYDAASRRLGPSRSRPAPIVADLPRALLQFALELFCPVAQIGEQSGGGVSLTVRGGSIEPAGAAGRVAPPGTVFEPLRLIKRPDGTLSVLKIPYTYLRVESVEGPSARCAILTGLLGDPLTRRVARKSSMIALGVRPGDRPTRLRFVTKPDNAAAAGYVLTSRALPKGLPREVGTTDREGRIVLAPGFASGLVALRLLGGSVEPLIEFPLMPGESATERTVALDPKSATVALEAQLDSLRDAVIDLVAVRARLEARLKARAEGDDWDGVEATLKELDALTPRTTFALKLEKLKEDATRRQAETKTAILTRTAQAQLAEVQALLDRYLDDDIARSYREALQAARERDAEAKKRPGAPRAAR